MEKGKEGVCVDGLGVGGCADNIKFLPSPSTHYVLSFGFLVLSDLCPFKFNLSSDGLNSGGWMECVHVWG